MNLVKLVINSVLKNGLQTHETILFLIRTGETSEVLERNINENYL